MNITASCSPTKWDEHPYEKIPPTMRMTKASVQFSYKGHMEGIGQTEYTMFYQHYDESDPHKATASYVGLTRFKGTLSGKSGSFVMEDRGTFAGGVATTTSTIVPGSGTDQLKGIAGAGTATATPQGVQFELQYTLP